MEFLGYRERTVLEDGEVMFGPYRWISFEESFKSVKVIGTALVSEPGLVDLKRIENCPILKEARILGIWALNCPYWLLTDLACCAYGIVSVPMYETLGDEAIMKIIKETSMSVICIDVNKLPILKRLLPQLTTIEKLIIFDDTLSPGDLALIKELSISHILLKDLISKYSKAPVDPPPSTKDDICTIVYTSGTSGDPKGAIFTNEGLMILTYRLLSSGNRIAANARDCMISYLPLSHVYERFVEHYAGFIQCKIGYYSGNIRLLLEDILELKPTFICGVPRVFTKILDRINSQIESKPRFVRFLVERALRTKKRLFELTPHNTKHFFSDVILNKISRNFGGKLKSIVLGSAAMNEPDIKNLQGYLMCRLSEGYGATEVGVSFVQDGRDTVKGTIGGPLGGILFKLKSIKEMEYDARGNPPRGELLLKGRGFMLGYLAKPELTSEVIDSDGWYHTGDVVELLANMGVRVIDRARNIFKLSQGEYIAPEKLENLYVNCPLVEQISIHGESTKPFIVAIVVVNPEAVLKWAKGTDLDGKPIGDLIKTEALKNEIRNHFARIATANSLNSLERLTSFILIEEPFSTANGLLTPTFKSVRVKIREHYKDEIASLYEAI